MCEGVLILESLCNSISWMCSGLASGLIEYRVFWTLPPLLNNSFSLAFLLWLSIMANISSIQGRHHSGLDPSNLSIFSNALLVHTLELFSSFHLFSLLLPSLTFFMVFFLFLHKLEIFSLLMQYLRKLTVTFRGIRLNR